MRMTRRSVHGQVMVSASPADVYHLWNQRYLYPQFMARVSHVEELDETWSRWVVAGENGPEPLDVETTDNVPQRLVAWRDVGPESPRTVVRIDGPDGGPTEVRVEVNWDQAPDLAPELAAADVRARSRQLDADLLNLRRCLAAEVREIIEVIEVIEVIDLVAARRELSHPVPPSREPDTR